MNKRHRTLLPSIEYSEDTRRSWAADPRNDHVQRPSADDRSMA